MWLIYNKATLKVREVVANRPTLDNEEDCVFATDPCINLDNYSSIKILDKEHCALELVRAVDPEPIQVLETTEQKLARLEEQNLILMDALATTFEEILELRVIVEGGV